MYKRIVFFITAILCYIDVCSQSTLHKYVYRLTIVRNDGKTIIQTGFKLNGQIGIITALHGVLNAKSISASNSYTRVDISGLKMIQADVENDIAVLNDVSAINKIPISEGLVKTNSKPQFDYVRTLGFPNGMNMIFDRQRTSRDGVSIKEKQKLSNRIPGNSRRMLRNRNSPNISKSVYIIIGPLQKGESGSPILNGNNEVIAIVDGGSGNINWAIPIEDLDLQSKITVNLDLNEVSSNSPDELFSSMLITDNHVVPVNKPSASPSRQKNVKQYTASGNCYQIKHFDDRGFAIRARPLSENETKISNSCVNYYYKYGNSDCPDCDKRKAFDEETYITNVNEGDYVRLIEQQGKWYKVQITESGTIGFITAKYKGVDILKKVECN